MTILPTLDTFEKAALPFSDYAGLAADEIRERTWAAKRALGGSVVLLAHHYQRDSVVEFADERGDSYKLAQLAASRTDAEFIVFCGVHFMAESADVLRQPHQSGDPSRLQGRLLDGRHGEHRGRRGILGTSHRAPRRHHLPITYMNSTAALKAFCGARGGVVCTSSNARAVLEWAWQRKQRVFFFPDQHLGRNTAFAMGVPLEDMAEWDYRRRDPERVNARCFRPETRLILWRGFCSVHTKFTVAADDEVRAEDPAIRVLVHPECPFDVVRAADLVGFHGVHHRSGAQRPRPAVTGRSAPRSTWCTGSRSSIRSRRSARCRRTCARAPP